MNDYDRIYLLYDLHAKDGGLIAPRGTEIEIIDATDEEARQASKNNRTTFQRFDQNLSASVIRLVGDSTLYYVHNDHIG